jgi:TRAP-type C4-dicarboxylate transport system substrate-binding protein
MWTWEGDPIAETAFRVLGINPIPLSIDNVLTSLQTGLIDAFYTSPYAALSLQWFTRVKYIVDAPLADASGAVLISKKYYDTLPKDLQDILIKNGRTYLSKLTAINRQDNKKSIEEFKKRGLTVIDVSEKDLQHYRTVGAQARRQLVGKLFTEQFLNSVEEALDDFRKNRKGPQ